MVILDQQVSVSGQIAEVDLPALVADGVDILVCNRPDNESADQTAYDVIADAAKQHGMQVVNIPFGGGQMQVEHISDFADLLDTGKRIHAYCRTGNRSSQLWNAAKQVS
ncbi:MAG: hypothetical protein ACI8VC_002926 [Candidatus Endobugula sp.]|jgi:uncharacterized protein (TIGR01244 family)